METKNKKFVLVDKDTHEIYVNQFGGDLPPMTEKEIVAYFYEMDIKTAVKKHRVKLYPLDEKHLCPHCQTPLAKSEIKGYKWQCFYCNEDFYDIEVYKLGKTTTTETNMDNLIIGIAEKLYNMQNDISFCQAETNIYFIGAVETAIKFLQWINNEEIFEYEFKRG